MMKVAIIEGKRPTLMPEGPVLERKVLGPGIRIDNYGLLKPGDYKKVLGMCDGIITRPGTAFSKEMISFLKKTRIIVSLGVGCDHIDLEAAKEAGIPVCNVPDYGTEEVADSTVAMLLAHQRKISLFQHSPDLKSCAWDWRINIPILRARHTNVGIVGLGRIGTAVALRLKGFGYKISFYDPYLQRGPGKVSGITRSHCFERLLKNSHIITLHTPLTEETAGMVNEKFLNSLRSDAILINTARGGIFRDADVLYSFLRKHPELRVGSDVWPNEPPRDHPLLKAWIKREAWLGDRLILTPHSAFYSETSVRELRSFAAEIVGEVLNGGRPYNVVSEAEK